MIDPGEAVLDGLTREVREETGLDVRAAGRARCTRSSPRRPAWAGACGSRCTERSRSAAQSRWATTPTASWSAPTGSASGACADRLGDAHPWVREPLLEWMTERFDVGRVVPLRRSRVTGRPTLVDHPAADDGRRSARILHVDMDAFFVSVELLRRPELRGQPVVVGGAGARGVVAAASYEARSYGVHSAMPSLRARRLCPDAVFLAGDHPHYSEVSAPPDGDLPLGHAARRAAEPGRGVPRHLRHPTAAGSARRRSAAWLRAPGARRGAAVAARSAWRATSSWPSWRPTGPSPGPVAPDRSRAAACSSWSPGGSSRSCTRCRSVDLWGVGPATLAKLERLGIAHGRRPGRRRRSRRWRRASVRGAATHLHDLAHGRDDRAVVADQAPKSISHEETFAADLTSLDQLRPEVVRMSDDVAARLRRHGYRGRTVQLKVRYRDFTTVTRSTTLRRRRPIVAPSCSTPRGRCWRCCRWTWRPPGRAWGCRNLGREAATQQQLDLD